MMNKRKPMVLTIAGFDPSSGAGVTADIKTIMANQCYGLAVNTAITTQNDLKFKSCYWTDFELIKEQIEILFERFWIEVVKIGIVENWNVLLKIVQLLKKKNKVVKIIVDPVLKASTNYEFHKHNTESFLEVLSNIDVITPNYNELKILNTKVDVLAKLTNVLLKGGHHPEKTGLDVLYETSGAITEIEPIYADCTEKHGSGCVLSSAIACGLAKDWTLLDSCRQAKLYTEEVLSSNKSLLGYHG